MSISEGRGDRTAANPIHRDRRSPRARCEVCRGARYVRLPLYREASASIGPVEMGLVAMESMYREYPCPECCGWVKEDRVAVLDAHSVVDERYDRLEVRDAAKRNAAHLLVDHLLRSGLISFETVKRESPRGHGLEIVAMATLGVVAPGVVASIEERATERGKQLTEAVAVQAIKEISNWGSYYRTEGISKSRAADFIREALRLVSEKWSKARAVKVQE